MKTLHHIKNILLFCIISLTLLFFSGCGKNDADTAAKKPKITVLTVSAEPQITKLYYNGIIEPIKLTSVTSPLAGVVNKINFIYGRPVSKGDLLLTIDSKAFQKNYQTALATFLTAKQKFTNSRTIFSGTKALYKDGLVARNTFINDLAGLSDAHLNLMKARESLHQILQYTTLKEKEIELLTLSDNDAVRRALTREIDKIHIYAKANGLALLPIKESGKTGGANPIGIGSSVKAGQELLQIGDLSGVAIMINVSEIAINQVKPGLQVNVTSPAMPNVILKGYVKYVSSQANTQATGGLPTFAAHIIVPKLTKLEQEKIHVGLSGKVAILIKSKPEIYIPINALTHKDGSTYVEVLNPNTKKKHQVEVTTGRTTLNKVEILSGLTSGEKIVIRN